jgi:hypothetical protein
MKILAMSLYIYDLNYFYEERERTTCDTKTQFHYLFIIIFILMQR